MSEPPEKSSREKEFSNLFAKGRDFLDMYSKVTEFTRELMDENSRLQARINDLIKSREQGFYGGGQDPVSPKLMRRLEDLKREKQEIVNHYRQVEEENKDFQARYLSIEMENNNLANLYVASYQLHSTLDLVEVLEIITEIIINLIGAQTFCLLLLNEKTGLLETVKAEGMLAESLGPIHMGEGVIGKAAAMGEVFYGEEQDRDDPLDFTRPLVVVPLLIKEHVIGAIVVYQLLPQKERLLKVDYDLFSLLAAHAATAVFSAKLYGDSVRKRDTIKGFLDLITH